VLDEPVVEVLATQVGVSGSNLDPEDTLFDGQERNMESAFTQIENKDVKAADSRPQIVPASLVA
jgi:hypothetical protein